VLSVTKGMTFSFHWLVSVNDFELGFWNFDCKIVCVCVCVRARANYFCDSYRLCGLCLFIILGKNGLILFGFRDFNSRLRIFVTVNVVCVYVYMCA
jgi:hypothetical protein